MIPLGPPLIETRIWLNRWKVGDFTRRFDPERQAFVDFEFHRMSADLWRSRLEKIGFPGGATPL